METTIVSYPSRIAVRPRELHSMRLDGSEEKTITRYDVVAMIAENSAWQEITLSSGWYTEAQAEFHADKIRGVVSQDGNFHDPIGRPSTWIPIQSPSVPEQEAT